jgi:hypothetical protein
MALEAATALQAAHKEKEEVLREVHQAMESKRKAILARDAAIAAATEEKVAALVSMEQEKEAALAAAREAAEMDSWIALQVALKEEEEEHEENQKALRSAHEAAEADKARDAAEHPVLRLRGGSVDDVDGGVVDVFDGEDAALGVGGDGGAHAAAGGGEGHFDFGFAAAGFCIDDAAIVNEAEVDDVDRDFGVVDVAELGPDGLFDVVGVFGDVGGAAGFFFFGGFGVDA